jgi:predicted metalloprotease
MNRLISLPARIAVFLAVLGLSLISAGSTSSSAAPAYSAPAGTPAFRITPRDVATSNQKVRMAHAALVAMWSGDFSQLGHRFAGPGLIPYYGAVRTACGAMRSSNALYCPRDNTIYFDEVFVAAQVKSAARELGTDGDMVAVGIIAHEMGHAVAIQLGHVSRIPYENEATADCLAGAFAKQARSDGSLEDGDTEEAFYAMSTAGDPTPELTGDRRADRWILTRAAIMGHGTREQRMQNFRTGLEGGGGACLQELADLQ